MADFDAFESNTPPEPDLQQVLQLFAQGLKYGVEQVGFDTKDIGKAAKQIREQGDSALNAHDTKIFLSTMIDNIAFIADANEDKKVTGDELYTLTGSIAAHATHWFQRHVDDPAMLQILQENISVNLERTENALIEANLDNGAMLNVEAVRCVMANLVDVADAADSFGMKIDNAIIKPTDFYAIGAVLPTLKSAALEAIGQCGPMITQAPDTGAEFSSGVAHLAAMPDPTRNR